MVLQLATVWGQDRLLANVEEPQPIKSCEALAQLECRKIGRHLTGSRLFLVFAIIIILPNM